MNIVIRTVIFAVAVTIRSSYREWNYYDVIINHIINNGGPRNSTSRSSSSRNLRALCSHEV
jgi:hypothetical protein